VLPITDYIVSHIDPNDPASMTPHQKAVNIAITRLAGDGRGITDIQDSITKTSRSSVLVITRITYTAGKS